MGLLRGTVTCSQYRISDSLPDQFNNIVDQRLKKYSFKNTFTGAIDEKTVGWTGLESILDTDFKYARYTWGKYIMFSMRIDRKIIPPALLKIRVLEAEKEFMAEREKKKLHRLQREEIKERVRADLLRVSPAVPSIIEVCWAPEDKKLFFCSLSDKIADEFSEFFKQSFNLSPQPFVPWDTRFITGATPGQIASIDTQIIGREFLTWLWFKSEERNGMISIPNRGDVEASFVRRVVLESGEGDYAETVVCSGLHAGLNEGREALRRGKKIKEARIRLGKDTEQWEFTFKADRFQIQSLKLPVMPEAEDNEQDRDGRILERIYLLETALSTMEELFTQFLKTRFSPGWDTDEKARMNKWLEK